MATKEFLFRDLERVTTKHGSHIDPELDQQWSDLVKLKWHAAVARVDHGVEVVVEVTQTQHRRGAGKWLPVTPEHYSVLHAGGSSSIGDFARAWSWINGLGVGADLARTVE